MIINIPVEVDVDDNLKKRLQFALYEALNFKKPKTITVNKGINLRVYPNGDVILIANQVESNRIHISDFN